MDFMDFVCFGISNTDLKHITKLRPVKAKNSPPPPPRPPTAQCWWGVLGTPYTHNFSIELPGDGGPTTTWWGNPRGLFFSLLPVPRFVVLRPTLLHHVCTVFAFTGTRFAVFRPITLHHVDTRLARQPLACIYKALLHWMIQKQTKSMKSMKSVMKSYSENHEILKSIIFVKRKRSHLFSF